MPTAQKVVGALIHGDGNKRRCQRIDPGVNGISSLGLVLFTFASVNVRKNCLLKPASRAQGKTKKSRTVCNYMREPAAHPEGFQFEALYCLITSSVLWRTSLWHVKHLTGSNPQTSSKSTYASLHKLMPHDGYCMVWFVGFPAASCWLTPPKKTPKKHRLRPFFIPLAQTPKTQSPTPTTRMFPTKIFQETQGPRVVAKKRTTVDSCWLLPSQAYLPDTGVLYFVCPIWGDAGAGISRLHIEKV